MNYDNLLEYIQKLESRIEKIENENVGTTNELYRIENRIDDIINSLPYDTYDLTC